VQHVGVLAKNVVSGNAANKLYQGVTLGNLAAGSTGTQLNNLVNKWFLGLDRPVANYGSTTYAYANASGTLFGASGPQYGDVRQGALGDCYYVGALGEVAHRSPQAIRDMFIVNGDGTYTVRFFNAGKAEYVTVDSQLPQSGGRFMFANYGGYLNNTANVLWVALAEKAYVQLNESGWIRSSAMGGGVNAYQSIAGGWFSVVVSQVAARTSTTTMMNSTTSNDFNTFKSAYDAGKFVGFASLSAPANSQIAGGHQYVAVGYDTATQSVILFNPWGLNNGSSKPGLVTIKWSELVTSFSYWDRA
jgi:Calpain family cysteine protease